MELVDQFQGGLIGTRYIPTLKTNSEGKKQIKASKISSIFLIPTHKGSITARWKFRPESNLEREHIIHAIKKTTYSSSPGCKGNYYGAMFYQTKSVIAIFLAVKK